MKKFTYTINLDCLTEAEAISKMQAATILFKHLSAKEITKLADVVKNEPVKTAMAKRMLGL